MVIHHLHFSENFSMFCGIFSSDFAMAMTMRDDFGKHRNGGMSSNLFFFWLIRLKIEAR